jgi:hypothetical protein
MTTFTISLAGMSIRISSIYPYIRQYCQEYLTDAEPDFTVTVQQSDLDFEREKTKREFAAEGLPEPNFQDSYLETLAVYRKIAKEMLSHDTILFHGSAIAVDGEGFLFTATSGTGKSTHTRLWREHFGDRAIMVNDDKPLLRIKDGKVWVCGTPWDGKHRLSTNTMVPLKGIAVLTRGEHNSIRRMPAAMALPTVLQQCHRPQEAEDVAKTLDLIDKMLQFAPVYLLKCNMDPEAAVVSYQGMHNL